MKKVKNANQAIEVFQLLGIKDVLKIGKEVKALKYLSYHLKLCTLTATKK